MMYGVLTYLSVDGRVLMVNKAERKGDPNSGFYTLPGGKLKRNERGRKKRGRLEAAVRETEEETGLLIANPVFVGTVLFDNRGRIFDNWPNHEDYFVYLFRAGSYSGELKTGDEKEIPMWIPEKEIALLHKNLGDEKIYEWVKDGRFFSGVIRHRGKVLNKSGTFVDYLD